MRLVPAGELVIVVAPGASIRLNPATNEPPTPIEARSGSCAAVLLAEMVELRLTSAPETAMPPPEPTAELPVTVELSTTTPSGSNG